MPKGKKPAIDSSDGEDDHAAANMNAQSMSVSIFEVIRYHLQGCHKNPLVVGGGL